MGCLLTMVTRGSWATEELSALTRTEVDEMDYVPHHLLIHFFYFRLPKLISPLVSLDAAVRDHVFLQVHPVAAGRKAALLVAL